MFGIISLVRSSLHVPAACDVASSILVGIQKMFMFTAYYQMVEHEGQAVKVFSRPLGWRMQLPLFNQLHSKATGIAKLRRDLLVL